LDWRPTASLEDLAALLRAFQRVARLGPALALAGVLAFTRIGRTLAGALALAGVDAAAFHPSGMSRRGESARREDRGGRGDDGALSHSVLPDVCRTASVRQADPAPCLRPAINHRSIPDLKLI